MAAISVADLNVCLAQTPAPVLVDVRRAGVRLASGMTIEGAIWRDPALWLDRKDELAAMPQPLVFVCAHGHEIGQGLSAALRAMGKEAKYLEGGFSAWEKAGNEGWVKPIQPSLGE